MDSKRGESYRPTTSNADPGEVEKGAEGALLEAESNEEKEEDEAELRVLLNCTGKFAVQLLSKSSSILHILKKSSRF